MIRTANEADLSFIIDLQKKFSHAVGFIPRVRTSLYLASGSILLGDLNDQEAGFLLVHRELTSQRHTVAIIQAAVRMDAQRQAVGLSLLHQLEEETLAQGKKIVQACCREDLESNLFWASAGFSAIAKRKGGKVNNRDVILWRKALVPGIDLQQLPGDVSSFQGRHALRGPGGLFAKASEHTPLTLL